MHEVESKQSLVDNRGSLGIAEPTLILSSKLIQEISTPYQFSDDIVVFSVVHQLEDSCNVWVVNLLKYLKLVAIESSQYLVIYTILFDDLDCTRR